LFFFDMGLLHRSISALLALAFLAAQTVAVAPALANCKDTGDEYAQISYGPFPQATAIGGNRTVTWELLPNQKLPGPMILSGTLLQIYFAEGPRDLSTIAMELSHGGVKIGLAAVGHLAGSVGSPLTFSDSASVGIEDGWDGAGNQPAQPFGTFEAATQAHGPWVLTVTNVAKDGVGPTITAIKLIVPVACQGARPWVGKTTPPPTMRTYANSSLCNKRRMLPYICKGAPFSIPKAESYGSVNTSRPLILGLTRRPLGGVGIRLDIGSADFSTVSVTLWHNSNATDNTTVQVIKAGDLHGSGKRIYWIHDDASSHITVPFNPNGHRPSEKLSGLDRVNSIGTYGFIVRKAPNKPTVTVYDFKVYIVEAINCTYTAPKPAVVSAH
jgi:hypothetical protein